MSQALQRLLTGAEAGLNTLATIGQAQGERLHVVVALDANQAAEHRLARLSLSQIIELGHAPSANLARVALVHMSRADEYDRVRDEHIGIVCKLVELGRRWVRGVAGSIEHVLTGRSQ